ncbi:MAG: Fur family transcriptional regulator [Candidatus Omnitrophota bacterium]
MEKYLAVLKEHHFKITPRRKAVLELFLREKRYLGPYEIKQMLGKASLEVGLPSIYRILEELEGSGILVKIEHSSRRLYYCLCRKPYVSHHHFICSKCNKVEEVEFCNFPEISSFIEKKLNARVQHHSLHIEGLCSECRWENSP